MTDAYLDGVMKGGEPTVKYVTDLLTSVDIDYCPLDEAISMLKMMKESYSPEHINLKIEKGYSEYSDTERLYLWGDRPETDVERIQREEAEGHRAKRQKEYLEAEFERLKKVLGK